MSPSTGNGKLAIETVSTLGERRIATVEPDGTGFRYVTGEAEFNPHAPAWSADGTRLAFWSGNFEDQDSRAGAIDPDGGNRTWMSESNRFFGVTDPAWSPDGETLAFVWGTKTVPGCLGIGITRVDGTESRIIVPPAATLRTSTTSTGRPTASGSCSAPARIDRVTGLLVDSRSTPSGPTAPT